MTGAEDARSVCGVVGLGFVGSTTMRYLWHQGFEVRGLDTAEAVVAAVRRRFEIELAPSGPAWRVDPSPVAAPELLAGVGVIMVAVRLAKLEDGGYGTAAFEAVATTLRRHAPKGALVIVESTLTPGLLRRFAEEWLNRPDLDVAHAPERLRVGDGDEALRAVPRLVGGVTPRATARAAAFLEAAGLTPVPVAAPEISELSKLLENAFLTTCISLIAEITRLAHTAGVPAAAVATAAATKPHNYMPFYPGVGIGGHCLRNDVDILRHHASIQGVATPLLDGVARVAAEMPEVTVRRVMERLARKGRSLTGARVVLVGVGFKPGSPDLTDAPSMPLLRLLREGGAVTAYLDSLIDAFAVDGLAVPRLDEETLAVWRPEVAVAVSGDVAWSVERLRATGALLLDAGGGRNLRGRFDFDETL